MTDDTRTLTDGPMSVVHSVHSHTAQGLRTEAIRRQAWQHVTCDVTCPNAGPWTIYGPTGADTEKYRCARCGRPMTVTELEPPS